MFKLHLNSFVHDAKTHTTSTRNSLATACRFGPCTDSVSDSQKSTATARRTQMTSKPITKDAWIQKAKALLYDLQSCTDGLHGEIEHLLEQGGGYARSGGAEMDSPTSNLHWPHPDETQRKLESALYYIQWLLHGGPRLESELPSWKSYWRCASAWEAHMQSVPPKGWKPLPCTKPIVLPELD